MKTAILLISIALLGSGCASYLAWENCSDEMLSARQARPATVSVNNGGASVGINVTALDYIREHPFMAIGAAVMDGATVYGLYSLADELLNDDTAGVDNSTTYTAGGDIIIIDYNTERAP